MRLVLKTKFGYSLLKKASTQDGLVKKENQLFRRQSIWKDGGQHRKIISPGCWLGDKGF